MLFISRYHAPNLPYPPDPQLKTCPVPVTAIEWLCPAAMSCITQLGSALGASGSTTLSLLTQGKKTAPGSPELKSSSYKHPKPSLRMPLSRLIGCPSRPLDLLGLGLGLGFGLGLGLGLVRLYEETMMYY